MSGHKIVVNIAEHCSCHSDEIQNNYWHGSTKSKHNTKLLNSLCTDCNSFVLCFTEIEKLLCSERVPSFVTVQ